MKNSVRSIPTIAKQTGNAAILFAMIIPALFLIFIVASDGARALQSKARLDDALEAASLAVAADDYEDSNLPIAYVEQYMTDRASPPAIRVKPSIDKNEEGLPILKYSVSGSTTHKSWFPGNKQIMGFSETFTVSGSSIAKRYQSDDIDVVFAADFSGSMYGYLPGSSIPKYRDVLEIIGEVTDVLAEFNDKNGSKNTAAFTAFNIYTNNMKRAKKKGLLWCYVDERLYNFYLVIKKINYPKIIENIFVEKSCRETASTGPDYWLPPNFRDVESEDFKGTSAIKLEKFKQYIQQFSPNGGTASYQGIIRAARLAYKGRNPRRLIIVLSDGTDSQNGWLPEYDTIFGNQSDHAHYTKKLVEKGMCDKIRETLNNQTAGDGGDVTSKIAVIDFGFHTNTSEGLKECTKENGKYNVFKANDREEIKRKILELISEEVGHLS